MRYEAAAQVAYYVAVAVDNSGRQVSNCFHHHRTFDAADRCAETYLRREVEKSMERVCHHPEPPLAVGA